MPDFSNMLILRDNLGVKLSSRQTYHAGKMISECALGGSIDRMYVQDMSQSSGAVSWFAVNIRPQCERIAVVNLERQGFCSFLPVRLKTVRHARQFRTVVAPLFPGYLFVSLDMARDRWRSVNSTYGVTGLVMGGDQPARVPPGIVEALVALSAERGVVRLDRGLRLGQRVKLLAGPFTDLIGTLERLDDQGRVRVLLEMMGTTVPVAMNSDQLLLA